MKLKTNYRPNYYSVLPASVRYDENLTDSEKILYSEIVALANQNGECWAGNTYFAKLYGVTPETISRRISKLRQRGYITVDLQYKNKSKQIDKRVMKIIPETEINHGGGIDAKINRSPQNNQGGIDAIINRGIDANVKENITSNEYYKINNKPYSPLEAFELFYKNYPKKVQRGRAETAFKNKVKNSKTLELILKDLEKRKKYRNWLKDDGKFIPHPSTYLNGKQWLDEYDIDSNFTESIKSHNKQHIAPQPVYRKESIDDPEKLERLRKEAKELLQKGVNDGRDNS